MYYDEEDNNKDTGIGENPLIPQEPEQNSPDLSAESEKMSPTDNSCEQQETFQETTASPADSYQTMNEKEYKANIKRMKREYKQFQKDKKQSASFHC